MILPDKNISVSLCEESLKTPKGIQIGGVVSIFVCHITTRCLLSVKNNGKCTHNQFNTDPVFDES